MSQKRVGEIELYLKNKIYLTLDLRSCSYGSGYWKILNILKSVNSIVKSFSSNIWVKEFIKFIRCAIFLFCLFFIRDLISISFFRVNVSSKLGFLLISFVYFRKWIFWCDLEICGSLSILLLTNKIRVCWLLYNLNLILELAKEMLHF